VNKECPHCGVDDFGLWDLFKLTLNYSTPSECRNCGGLVRNSGWGQFLTLLTTALLLVLGFVVLSPLVPEWIAISLLIALIPLPTMLFAKPVEAPVPKADLESFAPDPHNDKAIIVSGWNEEELNKALDDFMPQDPASSPPRIAIHQRFENLYRLTFPEDSPPSGFAALVNYLNYPIDLSLAGRTVTVAGKATLNSAFAGIPESLMGKSAIFYVPENDEDYDVVYLRTEAGDVFANSLNQEGGWRRVDDPRISVEVRALTW
jgi:hypothetical protein